MIQCLSKTQDLGQFLSSLQLLKFGFCNKRKMKNVLQVKQGWLLYRDVFLTGVVTIER